MDRHFNGPEFHQDPNYKTLLWFGKRCLQRDEM